jgi:hypothetical protein
MTKNTNALVRSFIASSAVVGLALLPPVGSPDSGADVVSFKEDVSSIIQIRCLSCHKPGGTGYEKSGHDMRTYKGLMKDTKFCSIITPGDAFLSNLNVLVEGRASKSIRMPLKKKKLNPCDQRVFRRWVNQGAKNN